MAKPRALLWADYVRPFRADENELYNISSDLRRKSKQTPLKSHCLRKKSELARIFSIPTNVAHAA